jgi:murein DD-endopeptidase MepM/ murein hydrolase activator NlpD
MNHLRFSGRIIQVFGILLIMVLTVSIEGSNAAYQVDRPVALGDEPIYQDYLYGEGSAVHKGVDFSSNVETGDTVYAVADGEVIQIEEDRKNGCHPWLEGEDFCETWGNFVLIQHDDDARHYDRTEDQMSYVYSLYLHLSEDSVIVHEEELVEQGEPIAQADNTGNSTGPHLHLQIILHPEADMEIEPYNTLQSEVRSRNPELWLDPYPGTGTVVGKVMGTDGYPVSGIKVLGIGKDPDWYYGSSLTYTNTASLNPDDILVENWATTDVTPGQHHITLSNGHDWGWRTVDAGQITYVGLYPIYLPRFTSNSGGWDSYIKIRNNDDEYTAQVNTTFFKTSGDVRVVKTHYIQPLEAISINPGEYFTGAAAVVSSEDISLEVLHTRSDSMDSDNGMSAIYVNPSGDPSFAETGRELYLPAVYGDIYNWDSSIYVMNIGTATADVTIKYKGRSGYSDYTYPYTIQQNSRLKTIPPGPDWIGSAIIESTQPLAVQVLDTRTYPEFTTLTRTHNAASDGSIPLCVPAAYKYKWGMTTGLIVQNISSIATKVELAFYDRSGNLTTTFRLNDNQYITSKRAAGVYLANVDGLGSQWYGSVRIQSTNGQKLAAMVQTDNWYEEGKRFAYNATYQANDTIILPYAAKNYSGHTSSYIVMNKGSYSKDITITYYNTNSSVKHSRTDTLAGHGSLGVSLSNEPSLGSSWKGYIVLETNDGSDKLVAVLRENTDTTGSASNGIGR